jgi:hypothetical protein
LLQELLDIGFLEFQRSLIDAEALLIVGPEHLRWRMTADVEIEIALDRRGAPVDVRVAQTLGTLRWNARKASSSGIMIPRMLAGRVSVDRR